MASSRRHGITVLGKLPKPINLPSSSPRSENDYILPNVEIVPKGTLSWGNTSSSASSAKIMELANKRAKQLQEEEELTRRQMAKARAKLEELNRRTQVVEGSNEKFESHDHLASKEATEKSVSYPHGKREEESATPVLDPIDSDAQRAKMRELAIQRAKRLQEEEKERTRRQKARARAKLEELNRRTQVVHGSNEKFESHSSSAIQNKQEESQTSGEPLMAGRKPALCANLNAIAQSNESSTGKVKKSAVPSSELPSETLKSACKEPAQMHDQSVPMQQEVVVVDAIHHNNGPQAHESNISRQKQGPKQRQNNQLEVNDGLKLNSSSMDHLNRQKSGCQYAGDSDDSALISVIDRKMNQHFDNLLHVVEGLGARLSQLETRLHLVENSVDDLNNSAEINYGRTDGKLRQLENILREVEGGMKYLRDKQVQSEAQLYLAKLQMPKSHQQFENHVSNAQTVSTQVVLSSAPQQSHRPHSTPVVCLQLPSLPSNVPPTLPHQNMLQEPAAQLPTQSPQNQIPSIQQVDTNYSLPALNPQLTPQIYYMSQIQQSHPPPTAPHQSYPPAPHISVTSQLQQLPELHPPLNAVDPQAKCSLVPNPGENLYTLLQSYPPCIHKTSNALDLALPTQQQYVDSIRYTHDQSTSNEEFSAGHMQPVQHSTFDDFNSHSGSPSHNSKSEMTHSQILPPSLDRCGGSSFSRLPTAQVMPYAIPTASSVDKESDSGGTGNRIPIDIVIDKVVAMGFRRDMVRARVRKMTEMGSQCTLMLCWIS